MRAYLKKKGLSCGLAVLSLCALMCMMQGCDWGMWKSVDYCVDAMDCDPGLYPSKSECEDLVEDEYHAFPECEYELDRYFDCTEDLVCGRWHTTSCASEERALDECEAQYGYWY